MGYGARFAVIQDHPRGPRMGSLKNPCGTFYLSSIETTALNCLVLKKLCFLYAFQVTDDQTDKQMDSIIA